MPWIKSAGGADRDRTDDLGLAKPALSQLSYSPLSIWSIRPSIEPGGRNLFYPPGRVKALDPGLEPGGGGPR